MNACLTRPAIESLRDGGLLVAALRFNAKRRAEKRREKKKKKERRWKEAEEEQEKKQEEEHRYQNMAEKPLRALINDPFSITETRHDRDSADPVCVSTDDEFSSPLCYLEQTRMGRQQSTTIVRSERVTRDDRKSRADSTQDTTIRNHRID